MGCRCLNGDGKLQERLLPSTLFMPVLTYVWKNELSHRVAQGCIIMASHYHALHVQRTKAHS